MVVDSLPMDKVKRDMLIDRYRQVVLAVTVALDHTPEDQLDARPEPTAWSAREVTHYLADFEMHEGVCLRRMLLENTPVLERWDPPPYVIERLHYHRPIAASLAVFTACGNSNVDLLQTLSEDQWRRQGNVQRPWTISVENWLEENVVQLHNRLMQIINAPTGGRVIPDTPA
jgi:hypothetical protein